jgi:hypothetical protein
LSISSPDEKGELKENIIGVTTKELCEYYKVQTGKSITTDAMKQFSTEEYEKLSNHDKFVQLDNSDVQDSCLSESSEKETNSIHENDSQVSSNIDKLPQDSSDNNIDHTYWTKGKWREDL